MRPGSAQALRAWLGAIVRQVRSLFPLTLLGLIVTVGSAFSLVHWGLARIDLLLLIVGVIGLSLAVVCSLSTMATGAVLWVRLRRRQRQSPLKLECGVPGRTGFELRMPWMVPFVRIGWSWEQPSGALLLEQRRLRVQEVVTPSRRASGAQIVRCIEVGDGFGLTRIAFSVREPRDVRAYPSMGALKQMQVVRSLSAGDQRAHPEGPAGGERVDLRQYLPGDPIKYVLWKVFARSREMVVRTPEQAVAPIHQTLAYLVTGPDDEAAAGAARVAIESGALGVDWLLGVDGQLEIVSRRAEALEALAASANVEPEQHGAGLDRFLRTASPCGMGRALIFVSGRPGRWLDRVTIAVRAVGPQTSVTFIVCTDGIERPSSESWWARTALRKRRSDSLLAAGAVASEDVLRVCRSLSAGRCNVLVLDRQAGRVYSEAHLGVGSSSPSAVA